MFGCAHNLLKTIAEGFGMQLATTLGKDREKNNPNLS